MFGAVAERIQRKLLFSVCQLADLLLDSNDHHIHLLCSHMDQGDDISHSQNIHLSHIVTCEVNQSIIIISFSSNEGFKEGYSGRDEGRSEGSYTAAIENQSCEDARIGCHSVRAVMAPALCNLHSFKIRYDLSTLIYG